MALGWCTFGQQQRMAAKCCAPRAQHVPGKQAKTRSRRVELRAPVCLCEGHRAHYHPACDTASVLSAREMDGCISQPEPAVRERSLACPVLHTAHVGLKGLDPQGALPRSLARPRLTTIAAIGRRAAQRCLRAVRGEKLVPPHTASVQCQCDSRFRSSISVDNHSANRSNPAKIVPGFYEI